MRERFGEIHCKKIKLLGLKPATAVSYDAASVNEVGKIYRTDLPSPQLLTTEFQHWKSKFACLLAKIRPCTLQSALQHKCDADAFPNIRELLLITCTLPVTECENARSNSQHLKKYLRSTLSEEELSALCNTLGFV